jgi:hypothetical protein
MVERGRPRLSDLIMGKQPQTVRPPLPPWKMLRPYSRVRWGTQLPQIDANSYVVFSGMSCTTVQVDCVDNIPLLQVGVRSFTLHRGDAKT